MDPMDLTHLVSIAAMWHHMFVDQAIRDTIYIRAQHVAFDRGPQWEPWNNHCIPQARQISSQEGSYFLLSPTCAITDQKKFSGKWDETLNL
ncbi:hypothetical protein VP01_217g1 [Puccinia sorghi]|uniref:Uncharacterized protein n=1 Tax=Puccinia sorghi TaxID=27349 RepID=A0A0L6VB75_9BASI|nr:hypothetical protein VP01_217g1 [Puccinia sorghi]